MEIVAGNPNISPGTQSSSVTELFNSKNEAKQSLLKAIYEDDKANLLSHAKRLFQTGSDPLDRRVVSKILHLCCASDSAESASALLSGEFGTLPLINEFDDETGRSPLHTAAESHAKRCVELLLKKRSRTDLKTKDGRALLPLELSFSSRRLDVIWNPDDSSVEDLVVLLSQKDLTTVRLLSEKTNGIAELAYVNAVEGRIVPLAVLLVVAAEKVNEEMVLELGGGGGFNKEKMTIYEGVIRKTLHETTASSRAVKLTCSTEEEVAKRRKLLLREIELLQLFGAVACSGCTDKKVTSPLIRASQAGDEAVIELLLRTNIDINDTDAEGNSALHWSLKTSTQQIKIAWLLLKHGARVSQKNKLGLTALHIAAENGNSQALQVFLLEDPEAINYKTEMKETPLFFAVKNDHMSCTELLLRWGANSEVLNLRQRPIDLATSQDMRFMLNPTNISSINRILPIQRSYTTYFQDDESFSQTCDALLSLTEEETTTESIYSNTKTEICKYFGSPRGCVRGDQCFYAHGEKELRQVKQGTHLILSPTNKDLRRRIFVGGLPPMLDTDSLGKFFEEQFGAIEEAIVLGVQVGYEMQSRGFGFVTFKEEKSVSTAVETHYVMIMGKQVEIKPVLPKCLLPTESQKLSPGQHDQEQKEQNRDNQPQADSPNENITEKAKLENMSWVDRLVHGQPKTCSNEFQELHISPSYVHQSMPAWLRIFKKWLPCHLKDQSMRFKEGEYALSSLKGDFRATFGLELDHASLGYPKLSDFMKSLPGFCRMRVVPITTGGPATHLVLIPPNLPMPHEEVQHTLTMPCTPSYATSINESVDSNNSKCHQDLLSGSSEKASFVDSKIEEENRAQKYPKVNSDQNNNIPRVHMRFLSFLKPDPLFHGRRWLRNESDSGGADIYGHQQRHLVLEALTRKRNSKSVFFLRDYGFYKDYNASIKQGKCFACNQRKMIWANFPCQHLLWCGECKLQAIQVAGASDNKCVVCDIKVQKIDLLPWHEISRPAVCHDLPNVKEFPPFDPNHIRSPPKKKKSPWISN